MSDQVINPQTFKNLCEKSYDKRKNSLIEIEKIMSDLSSTMDFNAIKNVLIYVIDNYIGSVQAGNRRGGLLGLASCAIGLGQNSNEFMNYLIPPALSCFSDQDSGIRFGACESTFNICKILKSHCLVHISEIFTCLSMLVVDPDPAVRDGANTLLHLIMDIVAESADVDFSIIANLIKRHMYATNVLAKSFIITWISLLFSITACEVILYVPEWLDGLFFIYSEKNKTLQQRTSVILDDSLKAIKKWPHKVRFKPMFSILIVYSQSKEEYVKIVALNWLMSVVELSPIDSILLLPNILFAIIPCLQQSSPSKSISEAAYNINQSLKQVVTNSVNEETEREAMLIHLDWDSFVSRMEKNLKSSDSIKLIIISWILLLKSLYNEKVYNYFLVLYPPLIKCIENGSKNVLDISLEVLCKFSYSPSSTTNHLGDNFTPFIKGLLAQLIEGGCTLLLSRGKHILKKITKQIDPKKLYLELSKLLTENYGNDESIATVIHHFNLFLLTLSGCQSLRDSLSRIRSKDDTVLFYNLFRCWAHNPPAVISLCLFSRQYRLACNVVYYFQYLKLSVDNFLEIDHLIQTLESPIFTYLRLHILDKNHSLPLKSALAGLLMIMPQSPAFSVLRNRLKCTENSGILLNDQMYAQVDSVHQESTTELSNLCNEMIEHFKALHRIKET